MFCIIILLEMKFGILYLNNGFMRVYYDWEKFNMIDVF